MGYIYNVCERCSNPIRIREKKDFFYNKLLKESKVSVCNICDERSKWVRY